MRGVLEKICSNAGLAQSLVLGMYSSQDCDTSKNSRLVATPTATARLAAFLPSFSDRISVTRKVMANRMLPSVISMPNALTSSKTSMLAAMVAKTVTQYRPVRPNRR